jgi:hypothetical protein
MAELPVRLVRLWQFHKHLRLGDLRAILAEADRRRLADDALVDVDDQAKWIEGVDGDGRPSKKYPKGDGGHYLTEVKIDGPIDAARPLPLGADHVHEFKLSWACACGAPGEGHVFTQELPTP